MREKLIRKLKPVVDLKITQGMSISDLVESMYTSSGFTARKLSIAAKILLNMLKDEDCFTLLSFPAAIVATGIRGIIVDFIRRGYFDCIITTCGTIDHDIARTFKYYYHGFFEAKDRLLHKMNIHRIGNIFAPVESYGLIIEEKTKELLDDLWKENVNRISTRELIWELARRVIDKSENKERSIIWWAWRKGIPIYVPGITDGAFGFQLFLFSQDHDFIVDVLKDEKEISNIVWSVKRIGGLIIGGGISKHHLIWWAQFRDGLKYAVYLTTAVEYDGSLSGARPKEAISWGKVAEEAKKIVVEGDATITLPLIAGYLIEKIPKRKPKRFIL